MLHVTDVTDVTCVTNVTLVTNADTIVPDALRVTWWWSRTELTSFANLEVLPPLEFATYHNLQPCNIVELTERVLSVSEISDHLVIDIIDIFHVDVLEHKLANCKDMALKI